MTLLAASLGGLAGTDIPLGPGNRRKYPSGKPMSPSKDGEPFQDARGVWYVRDEKGTIRRKREATPTDPKLSDRSPEARS